MMTDEEKSVMPENAIVVSQPRSISRRGLLRAAASAVTLGAIHLLPLIEVPGQEEPVAGFLRSKTALAEESFIITIVSKTEIGINVVDVANGNAPVEGATVTITSRFPKAKVKTRSAVTGEDFDDPEDKGKVIIDIADLSETDDQGNPVDGRYEFNGSISVKRPESRGVTAMRDYSTGLMRIKGASALEVSTHAMDDMQVYPERITFNDWDMHYTAPTFWRSNVNTNDQTILIRFAGCTGEVPVSISDHTVGNWPRNQAGELTAKATYDEESGYYVAIFQGPFLCTNKGKDGVKEVGIFDDELKIDFCYTYGGTTYHTYQKLFTKEAPIDTATLADSIDPISLASSSFSIPDGWGPISNMKFGLKIPDIPFFVAASPTSITLGVNTARDLLKNDEGKPKTEPEEIEMDPMEEIDDQAKEGRADANEDAEDGIANKDVGKGGADGPSGKRSLFNRSKLIKNIEINAGFEGYLTLDWKGMEEDPEKGYLVKHFDGGLLVGVGLGVKGTLVQPITAFGIPFYISFSLEFTLQASIRAAASLITERTVVDLPLNQTHFDYDVAAPVFDIALAATLTVAAGVKDILSLGVSGVGTIQLYIACLSRKMIADGHDRPHVVLGGKFVVELFFQALVLKVSKTLYSVEDKRLYDSWPEKKKEPLYGEDAFGEYEPVFRLRQPDGSLRHSMIYNVGEDGVPTLISGNEGNLFDNMLIVTEKDDLVKSVEFAGTTDDTGIPLITAADLAKEQLMVDKSPAFIRQDDGSYKIEIVDSPGSVTIVIPDDEDVDLNGQSEESQETQDSQEQEQGQAEDTQAVEEEADVTAAEESESVESDQAEIQDDLEALAAAAVAGEVVEGAVEDGAVSDATVGDGVQVEPMAIADEAAAAEELPSSDVSELGVATDEEPLTEAEPEADAQAPVELEAQAEPEPEPENPLGESYWKNPGLGFAEPVSEECVYEPVVNAEYPTQEYSIPESDVAGFAANGGIEPTVDVVINNGVFSDPRQRVVTIGDVPYLFRILTVELELPDKSTVLRSRLSASRYNFNAGAWDTPKVINFTSDVGDLSRYKIFDYAFDLVVRPSDATWYRGSTVGIVMTGGLRPFGDDQEHLYDIFASPVIMTVFLDANLNVVTRNVRRADAYLGSGKYHMVHCPHIVDRFTPDGSSGVFALSFVSRSADSPDQLMTEYADVGFTVGTCASLPNMKSFKVETGDIQELGKNVQETQMVVGKAVSGFCQQSVSILALYPLGYDVITAYVDENHPISDFAYVTNITNRSDSLPTLVSWPGHSAFLYTRPTKGNGDPNPHLYAGTFDLASSGASAFTEEQVDLAGFKGSAFGVSSSGNYIFFYESRDGWAGDTIDTDTGKSTGSTTKTIYRIRAAKYVGDKFCEDFVFCELSHRVDALEAMTINGDANTFIASEIIDAEHSVARMRYIAVPHCFASTVESFRTLDDFAIAGKPCAFKMTVHNHGNMIIRGFSVDFIDLDDHDKVLETVKVGEIKPSMVMRGLESYDWVNPGQESDDDAYPLSEALEDGALMPGAELTYPVTFSIPDYWGVKKEGEKHATRHVHLHIHDAWGEDYTLQAMDENSGHRFVDVVTNDMHFGKQLRGGADGIVDVQAAEGRGNFYDPEERWEKNKKDDPDDGGGGRKLPQTDDPYRSGTALGLALGGAASLLMGYTTRRLAVEQEEAEAHGRHSSRGRD